MSRLMIGCWNATCDGTFVVDCRDHDYALYCTKCRQVRTFVNLGAVPCPACRHRNRVPLTNWDLVAANFYCQNCQAQVPENWKAVRVYHLGHYMQDEMGVDRELSICPRDAFSGNEAEAEHGKAMLKRLATDGKRAVFIRWAPDLYISAPELPIERLRNLHACCNFQAFPGENTKFTGPLASFGRTDSLFSNKSLMDWLMTDWKVRTVWFGTAALRQEFLKIPPFAAYDSSFRVAP